MGKFLGLLANLTPLSPDLGRSCRGDCRKGRASCQSPALCAGQLTDAELAYEVTQFERDTAVSPICGATQAKPQAAGLIDRLKAWLASASGSRRIEPGPGSIADVIAIEHAAADEVDLTGLELERCQQNVRQKARLVAGLKNGGSA